MLLADLMLNTYFAELVVIGVKVTKVPFTQPVV